jgi:hypothetical protein
VELVGWCANEVDARSIELDAKHLEGRWIDLDGAWNMSGFARGKHT